MRFEPVEVTNDPVEIAENVADRHGWSASFDETGRLTSIFRLGADRKTTYDIKIVPINGQLIRVSCSTELQVRAERGIDFLNLLNLVNSLAEGGAFVLVFDEETSYLRYRDTIPVPEEWQCTYELIEDLIDNAYGIMELYRLAFQAVACTDEDTDTAMAYASGTKPCGTA